MTKRQKTYWFKRKRWGWGWSPVTFRGYSLLAAYFIVVLGSSWLLLRDVPRNTYQAEVGYFFAVIIIASWMLYAITRKTGPRPKFRWGRSPEDNPEEDI